MSEDQALAFTRDAAIATLCGVPYPTPTAEQLQRFNEDGFLVVENAIDPQELAALVRMGHEMIERPLDPKANDWDWRKGESRENRAYRIVQSPVDRQAAGHRRLPHDAEIVVCPIAAGTVTFHHSKTPHMTTGNSSNAWRLVLTQHFRNPACKDLPEDNYSWRVHVNQRTGDRRTER